MIKRNTTVATLKTLQKVFTITFQLFPSSFNGTGWNSVIHCSQDVSCCSIGSRVPALWFRRSGTLLIYSIEFPVNGRRGVKNATTNALKMNQWNTIVMSQTKENTNYFFTFAINHVVEWKVNNTSPVKFSKIHVWVGDGDHNALPGYLTNLTVYGKHIYILRSINNFVPP